MSEQSAEARRQPDARRQLGPDTAERISAGCYGALVAATTLAEIGDVSAGKLIAFVILTNVVYYATHVFAYTIGDHGTADQSTAGTVRHHLAVSAPIVSAAFAPLLVVLGLEAIGVAHTPAVVCGVAVALLFLAVTATIGARLRRFPIVAVVLTPIVTIAISVLLVFAKLSLK